MNASWTAFISAQEKSVTTTFGNNLSNAPYCPKKFFIIVKLLPILNDLCEVVVKSNNGIVSSLVESWKQQILSDCN